MKKELEKMLTPEEQEEYLRILEQEEQNYEQKIKYGKKEEEHQENYLDEREEIFSKDIRMAEEREVNYKKSVGLCEKITSELGQISSIKQKPNCWDGHSI